MASLTLRKPVLADVPAMMSLMSPHILSERLLPRSGRQVAERLREYVVVTDTQGVVGVGSVSIVDLDLAEVGALAADEPHVESTLIDALLHEARTLGAPRAFVLTHDPSPFERCGFVRTSLSSLPQKRDRQCLHCPRMPRCQQVALEIWLDREAAAAK